MFVFPTSMAKSMLVFRCCVLERPARKVTLRPPQLPRDDSLDAVRRSGRATHRRPRFRPRRRTASRPASSHSTARPRADGASARHRSRTAAAPPVGELRDAAFSAARAAASTGADLRRVPARSRWTSHDPPAPAGYAADRRLMPKPRMTCCTTVGAASMPRREPRQACAAAAASLLRRRHRWAT